MTGKGIDIVEIGRIGQACCSRRFCERVFTEEELKRASVAGLCVGLARRFALKEALFKALGTGPGSTIGWKDVEFVDVEQTGGTLNLYGRARTLVGRRRILFSSSHSQGLAIATVVIE